MAHIQLQLFALLLAAAAFPSFGFRLANSSSNNHRQLSNPEILGDQADEPEALYQAVVHFDGRPIEVLVDNLGAPREFKHQLGDPVSDPWPFIGAMGTVLWKGGAMLYKIFCTGSLIDSQTVLTAGHCYRTSRRKGRKYIFVHGLTDVRITSEDDFKKKMKTNIAELASFELHDDYELEPLINDIAFGKLVEPLTSSNSKAKPVCLGGSDMYNTDIIGAGWGYKDCNMFSLETLRKAKSTLVPNDECKSKYYDGLLEQNICTFFKTDGGEPVASASGDGGGPLFSLADPNKPVQIGTMSISPKEVEGEPSKCSARTDVPMVFARLSYFKEYIDKIATNVEWC